LTRNHGLREDFIVPTIVYLEKQGGRLQKKSFCSLSSLSVRVLILLYGLEALSSYKYQLRSLDFVINRFCMKLFSTTDIQVVAECQAYFGFNLSNVELARCITTFLDIHNRCRPTSVSS